MQAIDKMQIAKYWELLKLDDGYMEIPYPICYTYHA